MKKLLLLLALGSTTMMWAQSFTASVRGVVTDASRSAIPDAKVTITDVNRSLEHSAVSDNSGRYVITALPPGTYSLTAEAAGFKKYSRNAFELQVRQEATVDVELS